MRRLLLPTILALTVSLLVACGSTHASSQRSTHGSSPSRATPQINYVLILNGANHPRTLFKPGANVGLRIRVYLTDHQAIRDATTTWTVTTGHTSALHRTTRGQYSGPTRGNLFLQTEHFKLPGNAQSGPYVARVSLSVGAAHLTRTAHFVVRR